MTFTTDPSDARRYIEMGFDAVANNIDFCMIGRAYKDMIRQIRDPQ